MIFFCAITIREGLLNSQNVNKLIKLDFESMDLRKRVDKIYYDMKLSKVKTDFQIIRKGEELPLLKDDTLQVLLVL